MAIQHAAKAEQRVPLYRDLVTVAKQTVASARFSVEELVRHFPSEAFEQPELHHLRAALEHYIRLADKVLDQTQRRVFAGETVPASEKIVSIFEPHTDIIRKDRRDTLYGHKVFLTAGASGLVVDCVIERGNPTDSTRAMPSRPRSAEIPPASRSAWIHRANSGWASRMARTASSSRTCVWAIEAGTRGSCSRRLRRIGDLGC